MECTLRRMLLGFAWNLLQKSIQNQSVAFSRPSFLLSLIPESEVNRPRRFVAAQCGISGTSLALSGSVSLRT